MNENSFARRAAKEPTVKVETYRHHGQECELRTQEPPSYVRNELKGKWDVKDGEVMAWCPACATILVLGEGQVDPKTKDTDYSVSCPSVPCSFNQRITMVGLGYNVPR